MICTQLCLGHLSVCVAHDLHTVVPRSLECVGDDLHIVVPGSLECVCCT